MYTHRILLENNLMLKAICNRLGIDPEVYTLAGTKPTGRSVKGKISELTKLGYSKADIAGMLGCSQSTVAKYRSKIKAEEAEDAFYAELENQDKVKFDDELVDLDLKEPDIHLNLSDETYITDDGELIVPDDFWL